MKIKYYVRKSIQQPNYAQDFTTYIMIGRFAHLYCPSFNIWFVVNPAPDNAQDLNRMNTTMRSCSKEEFFKKSGKRARLEYVEDKLGIRFKYIAQGLRRFRIFRKIKFLKRLANIDEDQDWDSWNRDAKRPMPGIWMEK